MNKKHLKLAATMLDNYADYLENKCSNDLDFPDDWSMTDRQEFIYGFHDWNGSIEEYNPEYLQLPDFAVAIYLSALAAGESDA